MKHRYQDAGDHSYSEYSEECIPRDLYTIASKKCKIHRPRLKLPKYINNAFCNVFKGKVRIRSLSLSLCYL